MKKRKVDIVVVGAGISGATLAERYATLLGEKVLVIEKRNHLGGNCYDLKNEDGILYGKYGPHIFHTNFRDVWDYVNSFSKFYPFELKVLSNVEGKNIPVPVNIETINKVFGLSLRDEKDMKEWLFQNTEKIHVPKNSEEAALSRVGKVLYEKMFKGYTEKQWGRSAKELVPEILNRIPVRTNHEDRYFADTYQGLPEHGYTSLIKKMLSHTNIEVMFDTDFFHIQDELKYKKIFFTGKIDSYFKEKYGNLEYRSIQFEFERHDKKYFQENSVINYPGEEKFTRIVEYKYFHKDRGVDIPSTLISREFPTSLGEPYYPVLSEKNIEIFRKYQKEAEKLEKDGTYFVGRLANYKYFNMDQAFKNALDLFNRLNPGFVKEL